MGKKKGLFGVEHDALEIGKGVIGAVAFDMALNNFMGYKKHHDGGGHANTGGEVVEHDNVVQGIMSGIEDMTGMHGHPVLMAGAGLLLMQTEWREFGKGMALIGAYNAVTSHGHMRRMGAGMHGIGNHDVLAAIEEGIEARIKTYHNEAESQENVLGDVDGIEGDDQFEDIFKKAAKAA